MTTRVVEEGKIFLNDTLFNLVPGASGIPGRVITRIATPQRTLQKRVWRDHRGGQSLASEGPNDPPVRSFDTSWDPRWPGHLILGGLLNETEPSLNTGGGSGIALVSELDGLLVSTAGVEIYSFVDGGAGWTNRLLDAAAAPVDIRNGNLGGTEYLVIPYTSGYAYADAIASWVNNSARNCVNVEFHDKKLFGIDATGQCWFTSAIGGVGENVARINLSQGEVVTGLFRARTKGDNNAHIIYAVTSKKLYGLNFGQHEFDEISDIDLGDNNEVAHARPATTFKGKIYLAAGRSIILIKVRWCQTNHLAKQQRFTYRRVSIFIRGLATYI